MELKHANMGSFEQGYALCELPEIIQDVVEVCQSLELDYLWIDALCESIHSDSLLRIC